jgi:hypothetical protein
MSQRLGQRCRHPAPAVLRDRRAHRHPDRGGPGRGGLVRHRGDRGVLTGDPLVRRELRQLAIGAVAALVTYALGRVFGATLG